MDKGGRSLAVLPNEVFGHTTLGLWDLKNKHSDRHHMPEAAYEIRWILSIIEPATTIFTA